jgi:CheY-like chemotaxis protein
MPHKLLLADDSVTIQRVIELTFADEDIQVTVVGDGRQAIERVQSERPDIVLADIGMPERDGYEVAAFIKNDPRLSSIPVVLLTGAFEPLDETRARSAGFDGVLSKPFEPQTVINRVKELLSGSRAEGARQASSAAAANPSASVPSPAAPPEKTDLDRALDATSPPPPVFDNGERSVADTLEDYFDRLDAAFANVGAPPRNHAAAREPEDLSASIAELDQPLPDPPPLSDDPLTSWDPDTPGDFGPARQPQLANAFAALLAAEEGYGPPADVASIVPAPGGAVLSEDTIEEIVRRVIDRMGDETMRQLVVETAERLVREEIERIKRMASPR